MQQRRQCADLPDHRGPGDRVDASNDHECRTHHHIDHHCADHTAAPTTTIDPTDALIAEIEADLNEGEQVFLAGASDPASEASRTNLARYFTGTTLENFEAFYDVLVAEGFTARPNPDVPSVLKVNKVTEDGGSVIVEFCRIDAGVVVEQLGDGTEIIVNDEIIRYEFRVPVVQRDGTWTAGGGEQLSEQVGVATCD